MKKIKVVVIAMFLCCHTDCWGQVPRIAIVPSDSLVDNVSPHIFKGAFRVDSIIDIGKAYLITVVSTDSIETTSKGLSSLAARGVQFTIISFKYGRESSGMEIHTGVVYNFTLSPPGGIWTLYGDKIDDWGYFQSVQDFTGDTIKVPLPLIKTQLMLSFELNGLLYICNSQNSDTTGKQLEIK